MNATKSRMIEKQDKSNDWMVVNTNLELSGWILWRRHWRHVRQFFHELGRGNWEGRCSCLQRWPFRKTFLAHLRKMPSPGWCPSRRKIWRIFLQPKWPKYDVQSCNVPKFHRRCFRSRRNREPRLPHFRSRHEVCTRLGSTSSSILQPDATLWRSEESIFRAT